MKLPRRRPSDDDLRSWLLTGTPGRIEKMIDDPTVAARLDRLTELDPQDRDALHAAVAPSDGFRERTSVGVQRRVGDLERARALFDLFGLGARTVQSFVTSQEKEDEEEEDDD